MLPALVIGFHRLHDLPGRLTQLFMYPTYGVHMHASTLLAVRSVPYRALHVHLTALIGMSLAFTRILLFSKCVCVLFCGRFSCDVTCCVPVNSLALLIASLLPHLWGGGL
jgi:hypothetical protein